MKPLILATLQTFSELHWLLLIALSTTSLFLLRKALSRRTAHVQCAPGPPALPIIGHLHLLGELPHQSLCKLSKTYGPLIGLRFGSIPVIVASSSQMAKEILQTHDIAFAYRPRTAAAVHICFNGTDMTFSPLGPHWKFLRQVYATELFSSKKMESFRHVREGEARELLRMVRRGVERGGPVEGRQSLMTASNNINCRMVMGKKIMDITAAGKVDLHSLVKDVVHLAGVFYLGDYVPWLAWLDPNGYLKRMKATGQRATAMLQAVIDERRQQSERGEPQDLLDVLLAASMTDQHIMAAMLDVFVGGSETSAISVEWALAELINNPKVMEKLHKELDIVVGRERLVDEGDIENLVYLGNVIKESMRLHPIVPFLIPREAKQECEIGGFTIQPKTQVYVNTWAMGRDSTTWENPLEFCPDRFMGLNIDFRGQNFELLPFGMGRRRCPGWALGVTNVHLMLAKLVHGFTWERACGTNGDVFDMSESFGLTVGMAKPLHAMATPRLSLDLY